jgi:uncharacterized protein YuzE
MKITYDKEADAAYVYLRKFDKSSSNRKISEDIILDFGPKGEILGIEILNASNHLALNDLKGITLQMLPASTSILTV